MKRITIIFVCTLVCLACNRPASSTENEAQPVGDSNVNEEASPTPGLGYDPTRNDTRKENPLAGPEKGDSSTREDNAEPTPGLGNDPTRNNPSNKYASDSNSRRKQNQRK